MAARASTGSRIAHPSPRKLPAVRRRMSAISITRPRVRLRRILNFPVRESSPPPARVRSRKHGGRGGRAASLARAFVGVLRQAAIEFEPGPIESELAHEGDRPDLTIHDTRGSVRVLIENKFWAGLTDAQPVSHLGNLPEDVPSALLFIVPEQRVPAVWNELKVRCVQAGLELAEESGTRNVIWARIGSGTLLITSWKHVLNVLLDAARGNAEAGGEERLSQTGDNLANVVRHLHDQHPERLEKIFEILRRRVPRIERVEAEVLADSRLLLRFKDAPFSTPVLSRFASDGTLKMLAYLTLLHDPAPPKLIGVEEPENFLHPRLLPELAEECRTACERTQLLVTTHSPFFLDELRPKEVRVLWRDDAGYTRAQIVSACKGVNEFVDQGARLGDLWMEGHFGAGDPLVNQGSPSQRPARDSR